MKKFLLMALASLVSICGSAQIQESSAEGMTKVVYAKSGAVQQNATGTIDIVLKSDEAVGTIACWFTLPEGVTVDALGSTSKGAITYNFHEGLHKFTIYNGATWAASGSTPVVIASIKVNVPEGVKLGEYPLYTQHWEVTTPGLLTIEGDVEDNQNILADVTVQKAAVIDALGDGYSIAIVPAKMDAGYYSDGCGTTLDIYYTAAKEIVNMSFDIKLPNVEMYSTTDPVVAPIINNSIVTGTPAKSITIKANGDQALNVTFEGVKSSRSSKSYINAASTPTKLATVTIESEESLADGIYDILIDNISVEEFNGGSDGDIHQGNNYSTLVVGTPSQSEGIIYGYCTSSAAKELSTALKNVAIVDVTAATVDAGVKFEDVLVNEKGGNSYYTRTSATYGTTVLPLDLTTANVDELYMIESMDANSIVLTEKANVSANTPCIFKGTINVEGATPTLGVPSEQGLGQTTFKGTYSATNIAAGEGYYISSDGKFYGDGATVRPFRGYFDGAIAGVKSFSVFVNTANGLVDITNQLSDEAIYSLQGIRTQTAKKGVNIVGGKKVYIK